MKNHKGSAKGPSHKGPSSTAATAAADRKSRWESDGQKPSDHPSSAAAAAAADPKFSSKLPNSKPNPKDSPAGPSAPPFLHPHDRPIHLPLHPLAGSPFPHPELPAGGPPTGPLAPSSYGFHNLDRRTIVLADGSVRSYFALPPDYPAEPLPSGERIHPFPRPDPGLDRPFATPGGRFSPEDFRERPPFGRGPQHDYWSSLGLDGPRGPPEGGPSSLKRKYGEDDGLSWHRQHVMQYGNPNGIPLGSGGDRHDFFGRSDSPLRRENHDDPRMPKQARLGGEGFESFDDLTLRRGRLIEDEPPVGLDVDRQALKRAFLKYVKLINENPAQRKNYLEDGKNGPLKCIVCDRGSQDFTDVHGLVMHAYNAQDKESRVNHLGLHKALCVLMGWNYAKAPQNTKVYQALSADDVIANKEDLIVWPPTVIVHNTNSGRRKDGRMEGMGNKEMDSKLKELGFGGGKSRSIYSKEGHQGFTVVKFANTQAGLKEAERLVEFFEKESHGREGWACAQASQTGGDDEKNPALVKVDEKTGEKKRIFYGYLATASDLEKLDPDTKKKFVIKSKREFDPSD